MTLLYLTNQGKHLFIIIYQYYHMHKYLAGQVRLICSYVYHWVSGEKVFGS